MATNREIVFLLRMKNAAREAMARAGADLRNVGRAAREAARNMTEGEGRARRLLTALRNIGGAGAGIDRLRASFTRLKAEMFSISNMAGGLMGGILGGSAIYAGAAILKDAISTFAGFQKQMDAVAAVSNATEYEMSQLTDTAKRLGATTEFTGKQAGEGLEFLARAGFTAKQAIEAIPATLDLATAAAMDLGQSADIVSNVMSTFRLQTSQAAEAADILATVNSTTNTNVLQLAEALKYAGPIASGFGVSLRETASAIGVLGDSGIQASLAGTGVRMALIDAKLLSIGTHTSTAQEVFDRLKIPKDAFDPEKVGLTGMIKSLIDAKATMADLVVMFGARAAPTVATLMQGFDKFGKVIDETVKRQGEASRQAGVMRDNLVGDWKALRSAIEGLFIELGEALDPLLRGTVQFMTSIIQALQGAEISFKRFTVVAETLASAMRVLMTSFALGAGIKLLGPILSKVTGSARGASGALMLIPNALALIGFALRRIPLIGWIALAVEGFRRLQTATFQWQGTTVSVGDVVTAAWNRIGTAVSGSMAGIKTTMSSMWNGLGETISAFTAFGISDFQSFVTVVSELAGNMFVGVVTATGQLKVSWTETCVLLSSLWSLMLEDASTAWWDIWGRISGSVPLLYNAFLITAANIRNLWLGLLKFLLETWHSVISKFSEGMTAIGNVFGNSSFGDKTKAAADLAAQGLDGLNQRLDITAESLNVLVGENEKMVASMTAPMPKSTLLDDQRRLLLDYADNLDAGFKNAEDSARSTLETIKRVGDEAMRGVLNDAAMTALNNRSDRMLIARTGNKGGVPLANNMGEGDGVMGDMADEGGGGGAKSKEKQAEATQKFIDKLKQEVTAIQQEIGAARVATQLMREYGLSKEEATQVGKLVAEAEQLGYNREEVEALKNTWVDLVKARSAAMLDGTDFFTQWRSQWQEFKDNVVDATSTVSGVVQSIAGIAGNFIGKIVDDGMSAMDALKASVGESFMQIGKLIIEYAMKMLIFKHLLGISGGSPLGGLLGLSEKGNVFDKGGQMPSLYAKGGVFEAAREVSAFAKGGSFTNTIVKEPTLFEFGGAKKSLGMMGEAGPEAIMPLERGPDGKLGVRASGTDQSSGGGVIQISTTINLGPGQGMQGGQADPRVAKALANEVKAATVETIQKMMRPGGMLARK